MLLFFCFYITRYLVYDLNIIAVHERHILGRMQNFIKHLPF